jgi:excisionase family DNA binding protein
MTRRKGRIVKDSAQLGLPLEESRPALPKPQSEPIAVRIKEAIRLTGIGRSKLYELIGSGDLEVAKIGNCTLIPMASLYALIERAKSCRK